MREPWIVASTELMETTGAAFTGRLQLLHTGLNTASRIP
jgi:hypothetical protein